MIFLVFSEFEKKMAERKIMLYLAVAATLIGVIDSGDQVEEKFRLAQCSFKGKIISIITGCLTLKL